MDPRLIFRCVVFILGLRRPTQQQLADYRQLNNIIRPAPANFNVVPVFHEDDTPAAAAALAIMAHPIVPDVQVVVPATVEPGLPVVTRAPRGVYAAVPPPREHCPWELYCSGLLGRRPDTTWVPDTDDEESAGDYERDLREELRLAREAQDQAELALYERDMESEEIAVQGVLPPTTPNGKLFVFLVPITSLDGYILFCVFSVQVLCLWLLQLLSVTLIVGV